jgi:enoyl-CoA hydratase/carnithine racemase
MQTLRVEYHDKVAIIKLNRGVTNAINLELVNELSATLHKLKHDPDVYSLVLGSSNDKFFSIE